MTLIIPLIIIIIIWLSIGATVAVMEINTQYVEQTGGWFGVWFRVVIFCVAWPLYLLLKLIAL